MTSPLMKCRCLCPSRCANCSALRWRLSYTTTSFASIRRWTRWLPMKPAPPVMQMRFPLRAIRCPLVVVLTQRKQLFVGNAQFDQRGQLRSRSLERRHDHQVVRDLLVLGDRPHGNAEKLVPVRLVENRDRLQPRLAQRQIREFGRFTASVDGDAPVGRRTLRERRTQVLPHFAVEVQRVVNELVGETRLLSDAAWGNQI